MLGGKNFPFGPQFPVKNQWRTNFQPLSILLSGDNLLTSGGDSWQLTLTCFRIVRPLIRARSGIYPINNDILFARRVIHISMTLSLE